MEDEGEGLVMKGKGEGFEVVVGDMEGMKLSDKGIVGSFGDEEEGLGVIGDLGRDMGGEIVVGVVEV